MSAADSMQLISIVIAVNALISGLFLWGVNKDRKDIRRNMDDIEKHSRFMDRLTLELIEWMIAKEVYEQSERGMIYRTLKSLGKKGDVEKFKDITFVKRMECKKYLQHLMLFSREQVRRDSAHKQLINAYGDTESIELMELLKRTVDHGAQFDRSISELKQRINQSIKAGHKALQRTSR